MNFIFEQIRTGGDRNFAYLIGDRAAKVGVVVDPSYEPQLSFDRARVQGLEITHILNTHGHVDHVNGNKEMKRLTGAMIAACPGSPANAELALKDGDTLSVGAYTLHVMHVPGHCPDHLLFHFPEQKVALTGDHLFVGKIGGTGSEEDARTEYASLERTFTALPDDTTIWPGHDYGCRPSSTIGLERLTNPFIQAPDIDAFLRLKVAWAGFKAENGLA